MKLEKFSSLRVLVTGADGFIPSYVCATHPKTLQYIINDAIVINDS